MRELIDWFCGLHWCWYVVIGVVIVSIILLWKYRWFKKLTYEFVVYAEQMIVGTKMGRERFNFVITQIYEYVPLSLRWLLTKERIGDIIEWGVRKMKKRLEKELEGLEELEEKDKLDE